MFRNFHRFRVNPTTHITLASAWSLICPIDGLYRDNSLTVGTHTLLEILTDDAFPSTYLTKLYGTYSVISHIMRNPPKLF